VKTRTIVALTAVAGVAVAAALVAASVVASRGSSSSPSASTSAPLAARGGTLALLRGIPQHGATLGRPNAPVTLVEYADIQCPYCARFAVEDLPTLVSDYVRTGRVKIVFRGLAFVGPDSDTALRTAIAAGRQGRLWDVVDLLYHNQGIENSGWASDGLLRQVVKSLPSVDVHRVFVDRESSFAYGQRDAAAQLAQLDGVTGTPAFAVGHTGSRPHPLASNDLGTLRSAIDAQLAS
jgi:protein-disulfide isomerase